MKRIALPLALAALLPTVASAHVVLTQTTAAAGAYHAAVFRVGHGCGSSATTALTIHLPAGVPAPHAQPKAGWTLEYAHPAEGGDRVTAVTWRGLLPADQFDDFALLIRLPDTPGDLVLPVTQTCVDAVSEWNGATPGRPAPTLHIEAAMTMTPAEHHHEDH